MGFAAYIALERPLDEIDHVALINGKAVAREWDNLKTLARHKSLIPLDTFVSASAEEMVNLIGEEARGLVGDGIAAERWFDPSLGLVTVEELKQAVQQTGSGSVDDLVGDLEAFETVLKEAKKRQVRFHIAFDF